MRIALAIGLCLLGSMAGALPLSAADTASRRTAPRSRTPPAARRARRRRTSATAYRARLNDNTVTIMAGSGQGTDQAIVQDIAAVLDDGAALRVVPMGGKGPAQNLKDVMFMRGVDMGITQANVLKHFAKTGELGPNLESQVAYIAKLFNEEMHVLARADDRRRAGAARQDRQYRAARKRRGDHRACAFSKRSASRWKRCISTRPTRWRSSSQARSTPRW